MCLAGRQHAFIDVHGNVYPCLSFKAVADARDGDAPSPRLGNVRERPFTEIWATHAVLDEIRAATRATFSTCSTCTGACHPCMAASYAEHGRMFEPSRARCLGFLDSGTRRLPVLH